MKFENFDDEEPAQELNSKKKIYEKIQESFTYNEKLDTVAWNGNFLQTSDGVNVNGMKID